MLHKSVQRLCAAMAKSLSELPSNILSDILSRLPIKTIFVCRSVCKAFLDVTTSNPHFNSLHAPYTTQCLAIQFVYYPMGLGSIYLVDSELDTSFSVGENVKLKTMFQIPRFPAKQFKNCSPSVQDENKFILVNSCNGLLFFAENSLCERSFVCNPITREYVTLLEFDEYNRHHKTLGYWFGFSPEENLYKVLRIFGTVKVNGMPWEMGLIQERWAQVYTVGSSSWRLLEEKPLSENLSSKSSFAILNGTVCWLCGHGGGYYESLKFIVYFDFHTEKFEEIPAPVGFRRNYMRESRSIGVLGGCLCVIDDSSHFDVWVMKEFGCRESWTKEFSIDMESIMGMYLHNPLRPLQILGDGKILMIRDYSILVKFDPETKDFRLLEISSVCTPDKVVVYTPTFVPLKDILMVDNLTVRNMSRSVVQEDRMQEDRRSLLPTFGSVEQEDGIRIKDSDYFGSCPWSTPIFI